MGVGGYLKAIRMYPRHDHQVYMCACIVSPVRTGLSLQVPLIFKPLISRLNIGPARIPGRWRSHWQISVEEGYGHLSSVRTCGHGRPKFFFRLYIMSMGSRIQIRHHEKSDKLEYFPSHLLRGYVERTLTHLALIYFFMYEVCKCLIAMTIIIAGSTVS